MRKRRKTGAALAGVLTGLIPMAAHAAQPEMTGSYAAGYMVGAGAGLLAVLAGIVKCSSIMRRPTTSALCVTSLLLMLISWLLTSALTWLKALNVFDSTGPVAIVIFVIAAMLWGGALVTGIVGLATYDRQRFVQGRAQAIWGIVLSSLLLMGGAVAFVVGFTRGMQKSHGLAEEVPVTAAPQTYSKPLLNFSLTPPPDARWVSLRPEVINPVACLALRRAQPDLFCLVIAETAGDPAQLNTGLVAEIAKSSLASAASILQQREEQVVVKGITFTHIITSARILSKGQEISYEHWITTHNGFSYQIVFWCSPVTAPLLAVESRRMVETFQILDPARTTGSSPIGAVRVGAGTYADAQFLQWGYSTHLNGQGWNEWRKKETRPLLAVTAVSRRDAGLVVVPLRFDDDVPDLPALSRGLLSTINFNYPKGQVYQTTPLQLPVGEGVEITTDRELSGHMFTYVMRVIRGRDVAHLLASWVMKSQAGDLSAVHQALDAVDVLPRVIGREPAATNEQLQAREEVLNQTGLSYCDRQEWTPAAALFRRGFTLTKKNPQLLSNYAYVMQHAGKSKEALDFLALLAPQFPEHKDLRERLAWLQMESGDPAGAQKAFLVCIDLGLKEENDLLEWLNMQVKKERYSEALDAVTASLKKSPSLRVSRWKAEVLAQAGRPKEAVEVIEQIAGANPTEEATACMLAEFCNQSGDHVRAAALAQKLIQDGHNSARTQMILGWSQMGQKWYREARTSFEAASKLEPGDDGIKRAISLAAASLGQGDNSDIKNPIAVVEMPASVKDELAAAQKDAPTPPADASALYLTRATGYFFKKGAPLRTTIFRRIQVLNTDGVGQFSTMEFPFDPISERIYVNRIEVKDAAGKILGTSTPDDSYVLDRDPQGMATLHKTLHVQVPAVKPGCFIEAEITREDRSDTTEFPFTRCVFGHILPINAEAVFITGDPSSVQVEVLHGKELRTRKEPGSIAWVISHPPLIKEEPMMLPPEDVQPLVCLSSVTKDWKTVGLDYLKDIADRLEPDDTVRDSAAKLLTGVSGEKEKVAALARHVQKTLTYKAIEFGVRARRPNCASDTLRQRFGDCKDHALALHLLLKASGIESSLALIHTASHAVPSMPSLDQFNHMIVKVPSLGEVGWIDVTDKQLLPTTLPPENLWEQEALVLDKTPHLETLPTPPAGSASIATQRTISPDGDSDWRVEETLTGSGYYGAWIRSVFSGQDSATRTAQLQRVLDGHLSSRVQEAKFEGIDDPEIPATVHAVYVVHNAVGKNAAERSALLPAAWEKDYLQISFIKDRQSSFRFRMPFELTSDVIVRLPAAAKDTSLASMSGQGHSGFCEWEMKPSMKTVTSASPELDVHFHFLGTTGIHEAAAYTQCYEAWEQARNAWDARLTWQQSP